MPIISKLNCVQKLFISASKWLIVWLPFIQKQLSVSSHTLTSTILPSAFFFCISHDTYSQQRNNKVNNKFKQLTVFILSFCFTLLIHHSISLEQADLFYSIELLALLCNHLFTWYRIIHSLHVIQSILLSAITQTQQYSLSHAFRKQ